VFAYEGTGNNVRIGYLKSIKEEVVNKFVEIS